MQIEYSSLADATIQQFVLYGVDNFGERVALIHYNRLRERIRRLLEFPESGFPEPLLKERGKLFRSLVFEMRYKVIYHVDYDNELIVIDDFWDLKMRPSTLEKRIK